MTALDSIVATLEDDLLPGLNFSLSSQRAASYVKHRSFSSFYPSGSNMYNSSTGQRVIRHSLLGRRQVHAGPLQRPPGF
jgi:hypothetical protein